jgi:hypothetical protein
MVTRNAETIDIDGLVATYNAAAVGDKFKPAKDRVIHVKNASGGSINCTITTPNTVAGQAIGDVVVAVGAGAEKFIGPFDPEDFAGSDGLAAITWSGTTSVTWAVLSL